MASHHHSWCGSRLGRSPPYETSRCGLVVFAISKGQLSGIFDYLFRALPCQVSKPLGQFRSTRSFPPYPHVYVNRYDCWNDFQVSCYIVVQYIPIALSPGCDQLKTCPRAARAKILQQTAQHGGNDGAVVPLHIIGQILVAHCECIVQRIIDCNRNLTGQ